MKKPKKEMIIIETEEKLTIVLNGKAIQWEWKPARRKL